MLLPIAVGAFAVSATVSTAQPLVQPASQGRQLRADSVEIAKRARGLQASFERRRRQMLPSFYTGTADRCLIVGRFCEWHPNRGGEDFVPEEGTHIVRARAELLRDLERASAAIPGDDWIVGQRIRYLLETRDESAIRVARECSASKWWCDALLGLALHVRDDFAAADSAFAAALDEMPPQIRCHWMNLAPLLDDDIRGPYKKLSCAERETADARIWLVSDPLFMTPGNERRTEHFSRVVHTALQQDAANTYGMSWGGDLAELILRFGWAQKWTKQPPPSGYMQAQPSITGHEPEPGYHFFLARQPPQTLASIADSVFDIYQFPPREQYSPRYARAFVQLDAQVARFRRGDSTTVVAAFDVGTDTIFGKKKFAAALVALADEATLPSRALVEDSPTRNVLTISTPSQEQLVGVELLASDTAAAARWRSGFAELPLDPDGISVSDLLFVDGAPLLPADLKEATERAHGGTKFNRDTKIGLFWELYGKTPTDSAVPISLTITRLDEGILRRVFRVLRITPKPMPLNIRWQENGASGVLSARSILLDLAAIPAGRYSVKLEVGNYPMAVSSRIIEVK